MKPRKQIWQTSGAIVILVIIASGILYTLYSFWQLLMSLQKEVAAAIIAAMATVIVSVISIMVAKYYERKLVIEQEIRQRKIPMYEEFIAFLFTVLMSDKTGETKPSEQEMMAFFNKFTQKITIWGSDEVLLEWSRYRQASVDNPDDVTNTLFRFEQLLLAIRKDTGHSNTNINRGDILRLFINDVDSILQQDI